jgi:thiol-disulfide isomerase/thioredoxin
VTILEGTAQWCKQCKVIAPEVAKMVEEYVFSILRFIAGVRCGVVVLLERVVVGTGCVLGSSGDLTTVLLTISRCTDILMFGFTCTM